MEALQPGEKERFLELGVFPPDETTPEPAAATLWEQTGALDTWATEELLTTLAERSLVQLTASAAGMPGPRRFSLHDLIYDDNHRLIAQNSPGSTAKAQLQKAPARADASQRLVTNKVGEAFALADASG